MAGSHPHAVLDGPGRLPAPDPQTVNPAESVWRCPHPRDVTKPEITETGGAASLEEDARGTATKN